MVSMAVLIRTSSSGIHTHPVSWNCAYRLRMELSDGGCFPNLVRNCSWTIVPRQSFWITLYYKTWHGRVSGTSKVQGQQNWRKIQRWPQGPCRDYAYVDLSPSPQYFLLKRSASCKSYIGNKNVNLYYKHFPNYRFICYVSKYAIDKFQNVPQIVA